VAPGAGAQVLADRQAGAVEVVQHEHGDTERVREAELGL